MELSLSTLEIRPLFGNITATLTAAGFPPRDILPLIPPGAELSEASNVQLSQLGKIPGHYKGNGIWSGLPGEWPLVGLDAATVSSATGWPTQNVGLRAASFPAIDVDTSTAHELALVERVLRQNVPLSSLAPVRFRQDAPRALFVFRLGGNDQIRKSRLEWSDIAGNKHAVDVLGLGQQYVISGMHPSGNPYEWREGKSLAVCAPENLPALTPDTVSVFLSALTEEIQAAGGVVSNSKTSGDRASRIDFHNAEPAIKDPALALQALNAIPNTAEAVPTREEFIALLSSFKAATGREAEAMRFGAEDWATKHGWADAEYFNKVWDSITVSYTPHDHLISAARKHGWRGDAMLDFKEFGPDDYEILERQNPGPVARSAPIKAKPDLAATLQMLRDPEKPLVALDEMSGDITLMCSLRGEANFIPRPMVKADVLLLQEILQQRGLRRVGKDTVEDALFLIADENRFHPVRDYLEGLTWDGIERAPMLFPRYFGSEDNEYARKVGIMMLLGMVARVMQPPVKVDNTVILEGRQRTRKSMAIGILGGKWFSDHLPDIRSKDASIHLRGRWVVEIPEMTAVSKADANTQKSFMTRVTERYRRPYDRREVEEPRQNIFIGTTNEKEYLRDATGGRRWWPIRVGQIDIDALAKDRDQIFAETFARFKRDEKWYASAEFEDRVLSVEQEVRYEADPWEEPIANFVQGKDQLSTTQIALGAIGLTIGLVHTGVGRRIAAIMRRLGWEQRKDRTGARSWCNSAVDGR